MAINLHTVPFDVKQGESSFDMIKDDIIETTPKGKGRASRKQGWWKLDNGDWARREGAEFMKIGDSWVEVSTNNAPKTEESISYDESEAPAETV
jgi:hypothetical protein